MNNFWGGVEMFYNSEILGFISAFMLSFGMLFGVSAGVTYLVKFIMRRKK